MELTQAPGLEYKPQQAERPSRSRGVRRHERIRSAGRAEQFAARYVSDVQEALSCSFDAVLFLSNLYTLLEIFINIAHYFVSPHLSCIRFASPYFITKLSILYIRRLFHDVGTRVTARHCQFEPSSQQVARPAGHCHLRRCFPGVPRFVHQQFNGPAVRRLRVLNPAPRFTAQWEQTHGFFSEGRDASAALAVPVFARQQFGNSP